MSGTHAAKRARREAREAYTMTRVPLSWNFTLPTKFFSGKKYLLSAAVTSAVSLQ